jgi:hypothetical protein
MHESAAGQDTQNSWPVGITGFGLGVTDQPGTEALAGSAAAPATAIAASRADIVAVIRLRRVVHHFMITPVPQLSVRRTPRHARRPYSQGMLSRSPATPTLATCNMAASLMQGRFKNASMPFDLRI